MCSWHTAQKTDTSWTDRLGERLKADLEPEETPSMRQSTVPLAGDDGLDAPSLQGSPRRGVGFRKPTA